MAKIDIEVQSVVRCVCGVELRQVAVTKTDGISSGIVITVTPCAFCQSEARTQAYNKGMEYGRDLKD
jgi:hypothetical protein